ncbi:MAG: hypothetical protein IAF38_01640 [Bacteroidia bacterium]|nr:hypothetical protein [Bacteroidia bacterium]
MKNFFFAFSALCVLSLSSQVILHPADLILSKKIKQLKTTVSRTDEQKKDVRINLYNENGQELLWTSPDSSFYRKSIYDDKGHLISQISRYSGQAKADVLSYTYDNKGRITEAVEFGIKSVYTYGKNGLESIVLADKSGQFYFYDNKGRLSESYMTNGNYKIDYKKYFYAAKGDTLKLLSCYLGTDTTVTTWTYHTNGKVAEKLEVKQKETQRYTWNKDGKMTGWFVTRNNKKEKGAYVMIYDKQGLLQESTMNEKFRSVYQYNNKGLVIKETVTKVPENKLQYITVYEYLFY